jgi:hypothetical protein
MIAIRPVAGATSKATICRGDRLMQRQKPESPVPAKQVDPGRWRARAARQSRVRRHDRRAGRPREVAVAKGVKEQ